MSTKFVAAKARHPEGKSLAEALREDEPRRTAQKKKGIQKQSTLVSAGAVTGEASASPMPPNDEQLGRINEFTRSTKTADELVVFPTLSCNDLPDRDDDMFSTQCVKAFAALEQPFSPIGKSYMVGHDYSKLAKGRIFGVDTTKVKGATFLTNEVYVPNTTSNQEFIEGIDFGVNWAVSVGVMLGADECTVCQGGFSSWGWWCVNGHDKGAFYDPNSDEEDSWGYPLPCAPDTKGAIKCLRKFTEPRDFYELSQCFLGAQYGAEIGKGVKSIMKNAATLDIPIVGLSKDEALSLSMPHENQKVSEARSKFSVKTQEDGTLRWVDDNDLVWVFDPEENEVASLGKQTDDNEEEDEDGTRDEGKDSGASQAGVDQKGRKQGSGGQSDSSDGEDDEDDDAPDEEEDGAVGNLNDEDEEEEDDDDSEKGAKSSINKSTLVALLNKSSLPDEIVSAVSESSKDPLRALINATAKHVKGLTIKAEGLEPHAKIGKTYIESLKAEAIHMYVRAKQTGKDEPVNTEMFMSMLDAFGDNIDLIKGVIEDNKSQAQAKFPASVRRSTVDVDPNERHVVPDATLEDKKTAEKVQRLHG